MTPLPDTPLTLSSNLSYITLSHSLTPSPPHHLLTPLTISFFTHSLNRIFPYSPLSEPHVYDTCLPSPLFLLTLASPTPLSSPCLPFPRPILKREWVRLFSTSLPFPFLQLLNFLHFPTQLGTPRGRGAKGSVYRQYLPAEVLLVSLSSSAKGQVMNRWREISRDGYVYVL